MESGVLWKLKLSGQNALPQDTPEVANAKLQHFQNYAIAAQRNGVQVPLISSPLISLGGLNPMETPEVQKGVIESNSRKSWMVCLGPTCKSCSFPSSCSSCSSSWSSLILRPFSKTSCHFRRFPHSSHWTQRSSSGNPRSSSS